MTESRIAFGGIRLRTTIVATGVVVAALLVAAWLIVTLTRAQLVSSLQSALALRADAVAEEIATRGVPDLLGPSRSVSIQVVASDGRVLVSTPDIEGQRAIVEPAAVGPGDTFHRLASLEEGIDGEAEEDEEGPYLVLTRPLESPEGGVIVVVAASLAPTENAVGALKPLLLVGIPVLALVVAATTWLLTDRALRPVGAMAREADGISLSDLSRRISVPATHDEISHLGETLNRMLARLQAAAENQRRFVADASHELKSPVTALLTMAEVVADRSADDRLRGFASDVYAEARRLAVLVDDLLTLARSDEGKFVLDRSRFDLARLVSEQIPPFTPVPVDTRGLRNAEVVADERRMGQVVRNLLDNATRHARSRVWVETAIDHRGVRLVVADDGPGVPREQRERVFERFVRLDEARSRSQGGTGLGLAVVKAIVEAHGGTVEFVDDPRFPGAVVRVGLPHPEENASRPGLRSNRIGDGGRQEDPT